MGSAARNSSDRHDARTRRRPCPRRVLLHRRVELPGGSAGLHPDRVGRRRAGAGGRPAARAEPGALRAHRGGGAPGAHRGHVGGRAQPRADHRHRAQRVRPRARRAPGADHRRADLGRPQRRGVPGLRRARGADQRRARLVAGLHPVPVRRHAPGPLGAGRRDPDAPDPGLRAGPLAQPRLHRLERGRGLLRPAAVRVAGARGGHGDRAEHGAERRPASSCRTTPSGPGCPRSAPPTCAWSPRS